MLLLINGCNKWGGGGGGGGGGGETATKTSNKFKIVPRIGTLLVLALPVFS